MTTLERIFQLADRKFPEQQDFAHALGIKPSIVSQWKNGITKSYERRLHQIADVLDTTVEYLVSGDEKKPAAKDSSGREKEFAQLFEKLTPEQQDMVLAQLKGVLGSQGN